MKVLVLPSSHTPLLTRIVSCTVARCSIFCVPPWTSRLASMTMCLLSSAKCLLSLAQMTYLTFGQVISPIARFCCRSKRVILSSALHSNIPVPA